jgi:hypothetical protein
VQHSKNVRRHAERFGSSHIVCVVIWDDLQRTDIISARVNPSSDVEKFLLTMFYLYNNGSYLQPHLHIQLLLGRSGRGSPNRGHQNPTMSSFVFAAQRRKATTASTEKPHLFAVGRACCLYSILVVEPRTSASCATTRLVQSSRISTETATVVLKLRQSY